MSTGADTRPLILAVDPDGDLYVAALRELYGLDPQPGDDDRR